MQKALIDAILREIEFDCLAFFWWNLSFWGGLALWPD